MSLRLLMPYVSNDYARLAEADLVNLGVVAGAYRSLRGDRRKHIAYVTMAITTGKRLYDTLTEHGVRTTEELKAKLGPGSLFDLVIQPNLHDGVSFADDLVGKLDLLCIAPSVFDAKPWKWGQDAYMALWFLVISELAGRHFMMDGWEYSTGGMREVLLSMYIQWAGVTAGNYKDAKRLWGIGNFDHCTTPEEVWAELSAMRKIRVYDSSLEEIRIDRALTMCVDALYDLRARGFATEELKNVALTLKMVPVMSLCCRSWSEKDMPYYPLTPLYDDARRRLHEFCGIDRP